MDPDIFTILVTLAERELDHPPLPSKAKVLKRALIWLQKQQDDGLEANVG